MSLNLQNKITHSLYSPAQVGSVLWLTGFVASAYVGIMTLPTSARADEPLPGMARVTDGMSDPKEANLWAGACMIADPITGNCVSISSLEELDRHVERVRAAQRQADIDALQKVSTDLASRRTNQKAPEGVGRPIKDYALWSTSPKTLAQSGKNNRNAGVSPKDDKAHNAELIGARLAKAFPVDVQGITGVEYSRIGGLILNVGTQITPDKRKSLVLLGKIGEDHKQALAVAGIKLGGNQEIIFEGSYLSQESIDAETDSKFTADEWSVAVGLRIGTSNKYFKVVAPRLSASQSGDHDRIKSWDSSVASVAETSTYGNERNFVGERRVNAGVGVTMDIGESWELTLSPKATHRIFNDGSEQGFYVGGGVDYVLYLGEWGKMGFWGGYVVDRADARVSYGVLIPGTTVSADLATFYSTWGDMPTNYGWGLQFRLPLGGGVPERSFDRPLPGVSMNIKADTFRAAQAFASETREVKGKLVTVTVLKSVVSNAPGAVGTLTITNDGGWSPTDGEMNVDPNTTFNATTNTTRYEVKIDSGSWVSIGSATSFRPGVTAGIAALTDGTHTIEVRSVSASGFTSTASSMTVKIDTAAPSMTGSSFPDLDTAGGGFSGTISWNEATRSQSVTVSNGGTGSITGGNDTATHTITGTAGADPGWVRESVIDKAGNSATGQSPDQPLF